MAADVYLTLTTAHKIHRHQCNCPVPTLVQPVPGILAEHANHTIVLFHMQPSWRFLTRLELYAVNLTDLSIP